MSQTGGSNKTMKERVVMKVGEKWLVQDRKTGIEHQCIITIVGNHGGGITVENIHTGHTFFADKSNFIRPLGVSEYFNCFVNGRKDP